MWRAYVDETELSGCSYLLAASLVDDEHSCDARARMIKLRPIRGQPAKLHWHGESHLSRKGITQTIVQIPALHVVVVRTGRPGESSERRRRKCFERLVHEFGLRGVDHIVAEAREAKANAREIQYFDQLRAAQIARAGMRLYHLPGPQEPLLWIPDAVAGMVRAARDGVRDYLAELEELIDMIDA